MKPQTILIIGRPNVGKSTLFNHWVGHRLAIESKIAGTTRDFIEQEIELDNHQVKLIDTAGFDHATTDELLKLAFRQIQDLIDKTDLILFLVSAKDGLHALDQAIADRIRKSQKPVIFAATHCDNTKREEIAHTDFWQLGLDEPLPISVKQSSGLNKLEQKITKELSSRKDPSNKNKENFVFLHGFYRTDKVKDPLTWLNQKLHRPNNFWGILPNPNQPNLQEQIKFVLKEADINPQTTIVTHSLGSILALNLIAKNNLKIKKLILIAPPLQAHKLKGGVREELKDYGTGKFDFDKIKELISEIIVIKDKNDHVVLDNEPNKIAQELGGRLIELEPKSTHFNQDRSPEILEIITKSGHLPIRLALIGRPNVGKSTLLNQLLGENRAIVSDIPGTTRDLIEIPFTKDNQDFIIIDTAGLRRPGKRKEALEFYSVDRTRKAIDHADVVSLVIDGYEGVTKLDLNLAAEIIKAGRGFFFIVNKWDLLDTAQREFLQAKLQPSLQTFANAPIVTVSALTGNRVGNILPVAADIAKRLRSRLPTSRLNTFFQDENDILFVAQVRTNPPLFEASLRSSQKPHYSFGRRLENRLRREFDLDGIPINWSWKPREKRGGNKKKGK